ncbi:MAG: phosphate signaling complex protein PhoU [Armatimonadota bacterium]
MSVVKLKRSESGAKNLDELLFEMGIAAEEMLADAVDALRRQDRELAEAVVRRDDDVDRLEDRIEEVCLKSMARRIEDASQLRLVGAAMKIATDIERIADHAVDIARIATRLADEAIYKPLVDIPKLAGVARSMVRESLDAFVGRDMERVRAVVAADDEADRLYGRMRIDLGEILQTDPASTVVASYLLFVAHYLERVCDHCTNIAERVAFLETGTRRPRQR